MHIANLSVADALTSLRSAEHGLTSAEAEKRLREFGSNRIEEIRGEPQWRQFFRQFTQTDWRRRPSLEVSHFPLSARPSCRTQYFIVYENKRL